VSVSALPLRGDRQPIAGHARVGRFHPTGDVCAQAAGAIDRPMAVSVRSEHVDSHLDLPSGENVALTNPLAHVPTIDSASGRESRASAAGAAGACEKPASVASTRLASSARASFASRPYDPTAAPTDVMMSFGLVPLDTGALGSRSRFTIFRLRGRKYKRTIPASGAAS
jgi:hypothetical protein